MKLSSSSFQLITSILWITIPAVNVYCPKDGLSTYVLMKNVSKKLHHFSCDVSSFQLLIGIWFADKLSDLQGIIPDGSKAKVRLQNQVQDDL